MKYFTYDLLCGANDWIEQTDEEREHSEREFDAASMKYRHELEGIRPRISKPAWEFFRNGYGQTGLHDGTLLSANVSDNFNYVPDGSTPLLVNRLKLSTRIEFLNYEQDRHYTFDLRGVSHYMADLYSEEWRAAKSVGDLYLCELTAASDEELQLGFLFASGASIVTRFRKMVFRWRRVPRSYDIGERYR
jgi:hypothetical protein